MRRRTLLQTLGATACLGTVSTAAASAAETPKRRPLSALRDSDPDDIIPTWREGIETLQSLPESDPRNWDNLVRIHGNRRRFINCEHGNWLFFAWHRAYLHYHEEILREVTGNEAFALPYWNWLDTDGLPGLFSRDPFTNPTRSAVSTLDDTVSGREEVAPALDDPNFLRAIGGWAGESDRESSVRAGAGAFESPAHDYVHVRVGGDMLTGLSPNDPSFWAHHSMVDRLWWEWNARGHRNPADGSWLDFAFEDHFVDRDGRVVDSVTVRDALALPEREYTYPTRVGGGRAEVDPTTQTATASVALERPAGVVFDEDVTLGVDSGLSGSVPRSTVEPYATGAAEGRVLVSIRDIAMPETGYFHGRVYVDPSSPNPTPTSKHYAGAYHLWIAPPAHPPQNQFVDITDTLRTLAAAGELGDTVDVVVDTEPIRGSGDASPSTPVGAFGLEVTRSVVDGEVAEY